MVAGFGLSAAESPEIEWDAVYGGDDHDMIKDVVQTGDGGYALGGAASSFGFGDFDYWIVKVDQNGDVEWSKIYGGISYEYCYSIIQTSDGGYSLAGYSNSLGRIHKIWIVRTDSSGTEISNHDLGPGTAYSHIQTDDDGFAVIGSYENQGFLVKIDQNGVEEWRTSLYPYCESGHDIIQTSDGGYAITGCTDNFGSGGDDVSLIKTDSSGNVLWGRPFGGTGDDLGRSLIQTDDGGFAITGYTKSFGAGSRDIYLVKTDSTGTELWSETFGDVNNDEGWDLVTSPLDGGLVVLGYLTPSGGGCSDLYLFKTDSDGNEVWESAIGCNDTDYPGAVANTSDGGFALAAEQFDGSYFDGWLVKVAAESGDALSLEIDPYQLKVPRNGSLDLEIIYSNSGGSADTTEVTFEVYLPGGATPAWSVHDGNFAIEPGDASK